MDDEQLALLFNEWMRRFKADPDAFCGTFPSSGDYGADCVAYLHQLHNELIVSAFSEG